MLKRDELILITITTAACLAGYLWNGANVVTTSLPPVCLILMMFLSYLSIPIGDVVGTMVQRWRSVLFLTFVKMILLPLILGTIVLAVYPEYALIIILMAGMCSGSSSPYFGLLLKADGALLVVLVVTTSVIVPLSLPLILGFLGESVIRVPTWPLAMSLALYILVPLILAELFRKGSKRFSRALISRRKGLNVLLFAVTNFAVFANNAEALSVGHEKVLLCFLLSCLTALCFMVCGFIFALHLGRAERTSAMISFAMTNNILVIVLSGSFFGPNELLMAALYTIPFFLITIPIRYFSNIEKGFGGKASGCG